MLDPRTGVPAGGAALLEISGGKIPLADVRVAAWELDNKLPFVVLGDIVDREVAPKSVSPTLRVNRV